MAVITTKVLNITTKRPIFTTKVSKITTKSKTFHFSSNHSIKFIILNISVEWMIPLMLSLWH